MASRHEVLNVSEGQKSMHHPLAGELTFDFLLLQTVDFCDLRLLIYTPRSNFGTAEKIEWLLACESEWNEQNTRRDVSS
jgi:MmyB-like transcription regulator ligand binding domain